MQLVDIVIYTSIYLCTLLRFRFTSRFEISLLQGSLIVNNVSSIAMQCNILQCIVVLLLFPRTIAITIVGLNNTILLQYIAIVIPN